MEEYIKNEKTKNVRPIWLRLQNWWKAKTSLEEDIMTAEAAYCKSTYGTEMELKTIIKLHQHQISKLVNNKTAFRSNGDTFGDYFCMYSFPNDVAPYIGEILEPFKKRGYSIINLSERVEEFKNYNVYSISWIKDSL